MNCAAGTVVFLYPARFQSISFPETYIGPKSVGCLYRLPQTAALSVSLIRDLSALL